MSSARSAPARVGAHDDVLLNGRHYDFFVTVGMLERLTPDAVRIGGDGPYPRESIRFRHDASLAFSTGDISAVKYVEVPRAQEDALDRRRHRYEVTTAFLGLTGAASPLPGFMSEELLQAQEQGRLRGEFLDLFHHRFVSLVYRIGVKYDLAREFAQDCSDPWTRRILALGGLDAFADRRPKHIPLWRLVRLAPLLAARVRSGKVIEKAIRDICDEALDPEARVFMQQFAGGWVPLDSEQRTMLGIRNTVLGQSAVLGVQCYHRAGKAVVVIGPLHENFRRFLADGDMYPRVKELLELMCPEPIEFELDLVLAEHARPPFKLGAAANQRVGIDTWLSSRAGAGKQTHLRVPIEVHSRSSSAAVNDDD
ncbi:MAG TPA: type VI secretion system baseplate subunit TssG [Nannocystaceae bacterium]|nr:type VI secretion system baseplate subunit TssG [Nannocystaceae bacterium]